MELKPVILAVDDEPPVLGAIARDLRKRYGEQYRILRAESGAAALGALRELKLRQEPVALLLADQRMPGLSGVELLARTIELFPRARRALLTAYADTEAAIRAINEVRLDYYLRKPWDPPEEHLYPVVDDLLDDWQASFAPPYRGITVVGHPWSAPTHATRDFLARNLVPFRFLDAERDEEARTLLAAAGEGSTLPLVCFVDGSWLVAPSAAQLAEKLGLRTRATRTLYDLAIVGGGPAGLAAAVYGASEGLSTVLLEAEAPGGQAGTSSRIENYLGFPSGLSGGELTRRAVAQATRFGAEILSARVAEVPRLGGGTSLLLLSSGGEVACRALVVATGVSYRMLEVPGAERLTGAGVYYGAASTVAAECNGKEVYVLGAGNSAGQAAVHLAMGARSVTVLVRGADVRKSMSEYLVERLEATSNVRIVHHTTVAAVEGRAGIEALCLQDTGSAEGEMRTVPADALFVFIGAVPRTEWLGETAVRDGHGFLLTGPDLARGGEGRRPRGWNLPRDPFWLETNVPGVFAAGDVRSQSVKRVASAVGEGSMAVQFVHQYLAHG